ncbi:glucose-6-phosphate isomerase family protein [Nakamurella sp. A5-74]|uniref:glucose-6-phosphate isomerase n=1 Tax=Nakamurella sp. A5-74 TaxID=3158264 RepID=A0AAU8DM54_9ACTN
MNAVITEPGNLTLGTDGSMLGRTAGYEKFLGDMTGVYCDSGAFAEQLDQHGADHLVYSVAEHRADDGPGALIVGTSTLLPGAYGDEFAVTRGHLHAKADRAELYHCLSGHGVMLLETVDGESRAVELVAGQAVHVPGHWVHRSINVGAEPFVTLFCYSADAGQNYDLISRAGGMATMVVRDGDGWKALPNPDHTGYSL